MVVTAVCNCVSLSRQSFEGRLQPVLLQVWFHHRHAQQCNVFLGTSSRVCEQQNKLKKACLTILFWSGVTGHVM